MPSKSANSSNNIRVGLYARVSTKDKGQDTENQLHILRDYCKVRGWKIENEYVDNVSGTGKFVRPYFNQLMEDARQRKLDLVFFWSLDRFSREGVLETLQHLQKLDSWKVNWKSHMEEYLDSTGIFKDMIISLLAILAKQESTRRSERMLASYAKLRREGRMEHIGRKRRVFDRQRVKDMTLEGMSLNQIRGVFEQEGIKVSKATLHRSLKG